MNNLYVIRIISGIVSIYLSPPLVNLDLDTIAVVYSYELTNLVLTLVSTLFR
jgi:hypothetical protein